MIYQLHLDNCGLKMAIHYNMLLEKIGNRLILVFNWNVKKHNPKTKTRMTALIWMFH